MGRRLVKGKNPFLKKARCRHPQSSCRRHARRAKGTGWAPGGASHHMIGKKAGPQRGKTATSAAKRKAPARLFAKGGGCIGRRGAPEVLCITGRSRRSRPKPGRRRRLPEGLRRRLLRGSAGVWRGFSAGSCRQRPGRAARRAGRAGPACRPAGWHTPRRRRWSFPWSEPSRPEGRRGRHDFRQKPLRRRRGPEDAGRVYRRSAGGDRFPHGPELTA